MSNHYPHPDRYVPSRYLPTHYYRKHHEFGIPFKRYPLNYDEHEESGYYIDFNQTHLVYAVPCTDITFSKRYNRDDLKNETIDTTAETRETVGTTAARYHENTHSRHYPHCAHSSHVQGFDVLTISKLMSYDMELYDVTPERLKVLFENFACPQRDTVVFEHVWIEQHKFLSMYFKVHKKPLLDYCLFRFPEPPVCPGPVPPTPTDPPLVVSIVPTQYYVDPETCALSVDLLVTFSEPVDKIDSVTDYREIFSVINPDVWNVDDKQQVVLSVTKDAGYQAVWTVRTTIDNAYNQTQDKLEVTVDLRKVQTEAEVQGVATQMLPVDLQAGLHNRIGMVYEDVVFDLDNDTTTIYIAFAKDLSPYEETVYLTGTEAATEARLQLTYDSVSGQTYYSGTQSPSEINLNVQHNGHNCVEIVYPVAVNKPYPQAPGVIDTSYNVWYTLQAYLFKTEDNYLNYEEGAQIQHSIFEKVIEHYEFASVSAQAGYSDTLRVLMPADSIDTIWAYYQETCYVPNNPWSWEDRVNATGYSVGAYDAELGGFWVSYTFPEFADDFECTFEIPGNTIKATPSGYYNSAFTVQHPEEPPQPIHGPVLTIVQQQTESDEYPYLAKFTFDQSVEYINQSNIYISPARYLDLVTYTNDMNLAEFEAYVQSYVTYASPQALDEKFNSLMDPDAAKTFMVGNQTLPAGTVRAYLETSDPSNIVSYLSEVFEHYSYMGMFDLNGDNGDAQPMFVEYLTDIATDNSITLSDITTDPTYKTILNAALWAFSDVVTYFANNEHAVDTDLQSELNDIYNDVPGQMPADDVLLIKNMIDVISINYNISTSDLLTNTSNAQMLHETINHCIKPFVLYSILKDFTETKEYEQIYNIVNNTLVGSDPLINIYIDDINFDYYGRVTGQGSTELAAALDGAYDATKPCRILFQVNAVRNPDTGMINNETVIYLGGWDTPPTTPTVESTAGYYDSSQSVPRQYFFVVEFDQPIQILDPDSPVSELTDGVNVANEYDYVLSNNNKTLTLYYDTPSPDWIGEAADLTLTLLGLQIAHEDDSSLVVPQQDITGITITDVTPVEANIIGTSYVYDSSWEHPYHAIFDLDKDALTAQNGVTVSDGVNTATAVSSYVATNPDLGTYQYIAEFDVPQGTDWISDGAGSLTVNVPWAAFVSAVEYGSVPNTQFTEGTVAFINQAPMLNLSYDNYITYDANATGDEYSVTIAELDGVQFQADANFSDIKLTDGVNSASPSSYLFGPSNVVLKFAEDTPDWIPAAILNGTLHLDVPADSFIDTATLTLSNPITTAAFFGINNVTLEEVQFYDGYDGSRFQTVFVTHGTQVNPETPPSHSGYTFDNYYTDNTYTTLFNFSQGITGPTQVWCKYNQNPTPVNPTTPVYNNYQVIHTYSGTYSQTNTLQMTMNVETAQSGTTAKYRATGNVKAVPGPGASSTTYTNNGVKVTITIGGVSITSAATGNLVSTDDPKSYNTGWLEVPNGVGTGTASMSIAVKDATTGGGSGYCNYSDTASVNKPYTQ